MRTLTVALMIALMIPALGASAATQCRNNHGRYVRCPATHVMARRRYQPHVMASPHLGNTRVRSGSTGGEDSPTAKR
jgi:hypothetical protein